MANDWEILDMDEMGAFADAEAALREEQDYAGNWAALQKGVQEGWHDGRCEECGKAIEESDEVCSDEDVERFYCSQECHEESEGDRYAGTMSDYDERMAERRQMGLCNF